MWKKKKVIFLMGIFLLLFLVTACKNNGEDVPEYSYQIFYVNRDNTALISQEYTTVSTDTATVIEELLTCMGTVPEKLEYNAPLAGNFSLIGYHLSDGQLQLNFDSKYKDQEIITEILVRAAIVRTLSQVKEVQYVSFLVESEPLTDASGSVVGVMSAENFIDNAGNEINTYEKARIRLYFANEEGSGLTAVTRTKVYSSNIPMEKLIVEEIIKGPDPNDSGSAGAGKAYPVANPDTKVLSVAVRDGICYVNLDSSFVNQIYNVTPEVTIYAITNSLVELSNVNKVQISINGETNINYRENISLSATFERNLDLVE